MVMQLFNDSVKIKEIKLEDNIVRFVIDEEVGGFIFKQHKLTTLDIPVNLVDPQLKKYLAKSNSHVKFAQPIELALIGYTSQMNETLRAQ